MSRARRSSSAPESRLPSCALALVTALAACDPRPAPTGATGRAATSASGRAPVGSGALATGGGPAASGDAVRRVRPDPAVAPSGSSGLRAWLPPGATSAEATALGWALLQGSTPQAGLTEESYDRGQSSAPTLREGEPSRPQPSVRLGATETRGPLPPGEIQRVVRQHVGEVRACYEAGLKRHPVLEGHITMGFVVDPAGKTAQVAPTSGTELADPAVIACVQRVFTQLLFPASTDQPAKPTRVVYPLHLGPPL